MVSQRQRPGPGNLPVELSSFVGRARELVEVRRLLSAARVVTLTGPGGIGKSRLALRAAHRLARYFPHGVWLVELAGLDDPDLLPYALARSMSVYERPDSGIQDTLLAGPKIRPQSGRRQHPAARQRRRVLGNGVGGGC
jgi:hypothetical protein